MRTIKFRGFNKKRGIWLYGNYILNRGAHFIAPQEFADGKTWEDYEVKPETIGEFTGLFDEDGREIYEGDIIKEDNLIHKILWIDEASAFCRCDLEDADIRYRISRDAMSYVKVVGNIHNNSEMLEKGGEK